jgi:hypothetical protein
MTGALWYNVDVTVKGLLHPSRVPSEPFESKAACTHGLCYNSLMPYL